jgi:hypothetical protein
MSYTPAASLQEVRMRIHDMDRLEIGSMLERVHLGRLACALDGQPHVTPLFFIHEGESLFAFSTRGRKIDWMRQNPNVCVEFEEVQNPHEWSVLLVEGRYEELPEDAQHLGNHALALLQKRAAWWEPAAIRMPDAAHGLEPVFFRVAISHASGRRASLQ